MITGNGLVDIQDSFKVSQLLLELLKKRDAVAFVGAGASAELYGGWDTLIDFLINEAKERGVATDADQGFWLRHASRRPQQVVRAIKSAFGETRIFEAILGEYFRPHTHPETGKAYTSLHQAIVELPFKGIITTNYDPGLFEALRSCRSDLACLRHNTWQDANCVNSWLTGDLFKDDICPLLYAHGSWDRPETIILDNDRYREAYCDGPYRRAFQYLWTAGHLVIIGFGFSDSWLDRLLDDILTHMGHGGDMRHIALLGIREEDATHKIQFRDLMQNAYNATVLFYPIKRKIVDGRQLDDHSALLSLLRGLRTSLSKPTFFGQKDFG